MKTNAAELYFKVMGTSRDGVLLAAFFLLLPFIYALQVLSGHPAVGLVGYVPLLLLSLAAMHDRRAHLNLYLARPKLLSLFLFALVAHNTLSAMGVLLKGDVALGGRVLCIFVLPVMVFVVGVRLNADQQWTIMKTVAFTATIVAAELAWESISIWIFRESTWFQLLNRYYVLDRTGKDLGQLWWIEYRPTGLLEHVHVSTFYLVIGVVAAAAVYLKAGQRRYLVAAVFCDAVLVAHGVRFALLVGVAAIILFLVLVRWRGGGEFQGRAYRVLVWFAFGTFSILLSDPFGTVHQYYIPAFFHGVWNLDRPLDVTVGAVARTGLETAVSVVGTRLGSDLWSNEFLMGMFGHGIANSLAGDVVGLDDDFFVMQVFSQYGVIGGAMIYAMFAYAVWLAMRAMRRGVGENALLLAFALTATIVLVGSTLHSGVIQRKVMFALLFWILAIIYSCSNSLNDKGAMSGAKSFGVSMLPNS